MKPAARRALLLLLAAAFPAGCSGDGGSSDGPVQISPDGELPGPGLNLSGGSAGPEGQGGAAGSGTVVSQGSIRLGGGGPAPAAPTPPPAPAGGTELSSSDLSADVVRSETLVVSGDVSTSGGGAVRRIVSLAGSIVISGTLRGADLGGTTQGISLEAPQGGIFVSGTVSTSAADGTPDGDGAGALSLRATQIVLTGRLQAEGEAHGGGSGGPGGAVSLAASNGAVFMTSGGVGSAGGSGTARGGAGGPVSLSALGGFHVYGEIVTRGGSADGSSDGATGGRAGDVSFAGGSGLDLVSALRCRGGSARTTGQGATGGAGGTVRVSGFLQVRLYGTVDARGGSAAAAAPGAAPRGGVGGAFAAGEPGALASFEKGPGDCTLDGGPGEASGGAGGVLHLRTGAGDVAVSGALSLAGGPGAAGGPGGRVEVFAFDPSASVTFDPGTSVALDGGNASGAGAAGGGGGLHVVTDDGSVTIHGTIRARGGEAPGGTGGLGGLVEVRTDDDADGVGGNITLESDGLIDVSGGAGAVGGSARNDGAANSVGLIPSTRAIHAVIFDSDSIRGTPVGAVIDNRGLIVARGAAQNGSGGDVVFHGAGVGVHDPVAGYQDRSGHGSGTAGDFAGE